MEQRIGIFGGSGFYEFLDGAHQERVVTPYGPPSAPPVLAEVAGREVVFIPRHGIDHRFPAHAVPYRANLWAMKELGVEQILAPCACGSLQREIAPGTMVVCDQLVDRTRGRADTFYDDEATHVSFADPYCAVLRGVALERAEARGIDARDGGTACVVQGPRFSTSAEAAWFSEAGWSIVSMTPYPESVLARELELCYVNIAMVTNYASGIGDEDHTSADAVLAVFAANLDRLRGLLVAMVPMLPTERSCPCSTALSGSRA